MSFKEGIATMSPERDVHELVQAFRRSCDSGYSFPAGGQNEILTEAERSLVTALQSMSITEHDRFDILSNDLDVVDAYSTAILGVRLAILAVRSMCEDAFQLSLLAFAAGTSKLDWRDATSVLTILEDCGLRLGVELRPQIERVGMIAMDNTFLAAVSSYFARPPELRQLNAVGVRASGTDRNLMYH